MPDTPAPIEPETNSQNGKHRGPEPVVEMRIVLLSDGNVTLTGPLDNFRLVAQMLGQALQAAANYSDQKRSKLIAPATADALRLLRKP